MFHFCKKYWWSEFSFDEINHAAHWNTTVSGNVLHVQTYKFFNAFVHFYILKSDDWPCLLVNDSWCGVFQRVSAENMGPMQQAEISRVKTNPSHKQVSRNVQNLQEYYFPIRRDILSNCVTECAVLTIVTMQPAFEPQARKTNFSDFSFEKRMKSLQGSCI